MVIVDAHCDTATRIMELGTNLYDSGCHADLRRMHALGSYVQFFAAFVNPVEYKAVEMRRAMHIIDGIYRQADVYGDYMHICTNCDEIALALNEGKIAALISIEGGEALQGQLSALRMFYRLGVRSICLTWNYRNEIADGVKDGISDGGLTPFGRDVIKEMNRLGMLVDISHLSEKGFRDVMGLTEAPVIASHSNAKAVCDHVRNLTDGQMRAVKRNGGVIGVNLYPYFLNNTGTAFIDDVIRQIEHICVLIGEDHIGLGCDFDGIECTPQDIKGVEGIDKIFEKLLALNYSQSFVEKFAGGNFMRVIREVIK